MVEGILVVVVLLRFLIPLGAFRYPLPAILLSLVIDAADQTVLAAFDAEPSNYQQYDKALDVYYLAIAYMSTLRNWPVGAAFRVSQFLWYWRLIGVLLFEVSFNRSLLLIFPNTFEFFFIFYEVVRLRYEPSRLPSRTVIAVAAAIWIFIKLPQEYWIHVAQLDFTTVVGNDPSILVFAGLILALPYGWFRNQTIDIPKIDWNWSFAVDSHCTTVFGRPAAAPFASYALINHPLLEKTVLVGLITGIFLQLVPTMSGSLAAVGIGVAVIIVSSSFVGHWLCRHGSNWTTTTADIVATTLINTAVLFALSFLPLNGGPGLLFASFLLALLTLIVTLYDRYRSFRLASIEPVVMKQPAVAA